MAKETRYEKLCKELKENTKATAYSKGALQSMANTYMNDLEHTSKTYKAADDDKFEVIERTPAKDFREGMKTVVKKTFGVDSAELGKLDEAELPKALTNAMIDCIQDVEVDYMRTGKKLKYPITSDKDTAMSISLRDVEEKTVATKKNVQKEDGTWEQVPTGDTYKYEAHTELKSSNKIPAWLKKKVN